MSQDHGAASSASPNVRYVRSADWHATAEGEHISALAGYLDEVATLPLMRRVTEQKLVSLRLEPGQRVLDVGCGNGVFLPLLAAGVGSSGQVDAIDHAAPFVTAAQERVKTAGFADRVTVQAGNAYQLPFADGTFDAAHCERVLMHLDDPTAVLREMRRVVRPGGRVVAAEPDWLGFTIDHPDHEAMQELYERYCTRTFRQPRMGRTLNRRMFEAGLVDREVVPVMESTMTYRTLTQYGFEPTAAANELIAEGKYTRERIDNLLAYFDTASANGSEWLCGGIFVAAGQTPV